MSIRFRFLGVLVAILLCGLINTDVNVTAQDIPEASGQAWFPLPAAGEERAPVPGGPGYVIASPFAIIPYMQPSQYGFTGSLLQNYGPSSATFVIPLNLPHGATITKVVGYYHDADSSLNIIVSLYRDRFDSYTRQLMAQALSFGSAGYINSSDTSIDYAEVDLSSYGYSLDVQIPANAPSLGFLGARVDYEYPVYLPNVEN